MASSVFLWPGLFTNNGSAIVFPSNLPIDVQRTSLGTTSTDGVIVENTTAATAGATVQISPRLRLTGTAWNSSGSASEKDSFFIENLPATVAGTTTATLKFGVSIAGGAATYPLTLTDSGSLTALGVIKGSNFYTGNYLVGASGNGTILDPSTTGTLVITTNAGTAGFALDGTTDTTMKVRNRALNAYAAVDALGYKVSGVAGANFGPAAVASITVVNGIVTAIS